MKKTMKIVAIILVAIMLLSTTAFAAITVDLDFDNASSKLTGGDSSASEAVGKMANSILNVVKVVGIAVAIIMLIVLAIKYISAAPSDKAEIKKHAVVYVVGAVVLFGASGIIGIIQGFVDGAGL